MFFFESGGFEAMFSLIFILFIGTFAFILVKGIGQWHHNNQSPRLTVQAKVVSKRSDVSFHHSANDHMMHTSSTSYYVTFEVKSGDRMEFSVSGREYGMLAENDMGELTFQGTRYIEFIRM